MGSHTPIILSEVSASLREADTQSNGSLHCRSREGHEFTRAVTLRHAIGFSR